MIIMKQELKTVDGHTIKLNDVFYRSWGYEQTNINFVKVVGFTPSGKSVKVVSVGQTITEPMGDMAEKVSPDTDFVQSEQSRNFLIASYNGKLELKGDGDYFSLYENPLYQSHYA